MIDLIRDQFANYVIQRVIDLSNRTQLNVIVADLRSNIAAVKKCTYGKHILTRIEKTTGEKL